jgi:hypothetical protein
MRIGRSIAAAAIGLLLAGQVSAYQKIICYNLSPPELVMPGVRRIAVMNFEGDGGQNASDRLVSYLLEKDRGIQDVSKGFFSGKAKGRTFQEWATTNVFDIVERTQLEQVMQEQKLGMSGLVDDSQAAQLGKVLGVDAIITGSVRHEHRDRTIEKTQTKTKKVNGEKVKYKEKYQCLERTVSATIKMRVISTETAQILGNKEFSGTEKEEKCRNERSAISSVQSLLDDVLTSTMRDAATYISPTFTLLKKDFAKIKLNKFKKQADKAAKLGEKGELDQACLIYQAMYEADPYNTQILYNLGLLNEAVGNFGKAKEMYENALFLKSDEKDYQKALARAQKASEFSDVLKALGLSVTTYEWGVSAAAMAKATASKVVVKGNNTDRQPVRSAADNASGVVVRVPGGIELTVLSREGEWYRVQLLGNKEGYLHKSQIGKFK